MSGHPAPILKSVQLLCDIANRDTDLVAPVARLACTNAQLRYPNNGHYNNYLFQYYYIYTILTLHIVVVTPAMTY